MLAVLVNGGSSALGLPMTLTLVGVVYVMSRVKLDRIS